MKEFFKVTAAIFIILLISQTAFSQAISIPDTLQGWKKTWALSLNGSQASYSNWSQGGVSSISGTGSSVFTVLHRSAKLGYGSRINLKYGQSNVKGEGVRKTDDVISIRNRVTYPLEDKGVLYAYGSIWFQTQFDKGYDYDGKVAGGDSLISDFLAPAYITEGAGLAYIPKDYITFEAGLALKQTIVRDDSLTENYGLAPGDNFRSEGGFTLGINFQKDIAENIRYTSSIDTFTNFLMSISKTDVAWSNELVGQINKIVSASFQFEMRYDDDFSSEVQLKQVLSAGVSVSIY